MRELELIVSPAEDGLTAGELLKGRGFSRRVVVALKASGGLTRNGEILRTVDRVRAGELVRAALFEEG
ncbi:MAG: RluA family pseudouridine synthase, partial [Oscillospiraceae bacterium]|nr:RluA family pseudouridine synthase [Oscillospiraceae bacterium]